MRAAAVAAAPPATEEGESSMSSTLPAPVDFDGQRRRLTIACALLDQAAGHLERLDHDRTLSDEQRADVDAALEFVLIAGEEIDPMVA
jgi:hypothetical protein